MQGGGGKGIPTSACCDASEFVAPGHTPLPVTVASSVGSWLLLVMVPTYLLHVWARDAGVGKDAGVPPLGFFTRVREWADCPVMDVAF